MIIHPKTLADGLANAFTVGKEKIKAVKACPHVFIAYDEPESGPAFYVYGMGRYVAGRTVVPTGTEATGAFASVSVTRENADLLQSMLRKGGTKKTDSVSVTISDEPKLITSHDEMGQPIQKYVNLIITGENGNMAELTDADPEGNSEGCWDFVDEKIKEEPEPGAERMAFVSEVIARLKDIKADGPVIDLKKTSHDRITAVAIGSTFRGVMGNVGRELYAEGGPWGDGPGKPEHLLT